MIGYYRSLLIGSITEKEYNFSFNVVNGIGEEAGVSRRDPSDIFKIGDTYYVYYSRYNGAYTERPGYESSTYLAKSTDTINWTEVGEVIPKGTAGQWDQQSAHTPDVMILNGVIYLYYHSADYPYSETDSQVHVGMAYQNVEDIELLPYTKRVDNPILSPSATTSDFDSFRIDGIQPILQGDEIYLYYKGRKQGQTPQQTRHGLAICDASNPLGDYVKYVNNPVYDAGHEVVIFRCGSKLRSLIDEQGYDSSLHNSLLESENGLIWNKIRNINPPFASGYFREDNFINQFNSENLTWGLFTEYGADGLPYLKKYIVT